MENINYDLKMKEELATFTSKKKLLLHVCCGPCSSNVIKELIEYFDITIYYSNSNIYPKEEYVRRRDELISFIERFNKDYDTHIEVIEDQYDYDEFYEHISPVGILGEGSIRCNLCYSLRMRRAFDYARMRDYDYWTTVLSVSPHKNSQWINQIGEKWPNDKVKFLYADFKKNDGYKKSTEMAAQYNLYRQDYCGCSYSLKEAEERRKNKKS